MRFVDTFPVRFSDDAEFESKHKRDDDGKFSKTNKSRTEESENKLNSPVSDLLQERKELNETPKERSKRIFKEIRDCKKILSEGEDPQKVIEKAAISLVGVVKAELSDGEVCDIEIGSAFVKECKKYLFFPRSSRQRPKAQQQEIVKRQLEAYLRLGRLLRVGKRTEWRPEPKHKGWEFMTVYGRCNLGDKKPLFTVDIRRRLNKQQAYNTSTEGNPGFDFKVKKMGLMDGYNYSLELLGIFLE